MGLRRSIRPSIPLGRLCSSEGWRDEGMGEEMIVVDVPDIVHPRLGSLLPIVIPLHHHMPRGPMPY